MGKKGKPMTDLSAFLPLAHRLADVARPIVRRYFRTGVVVDDKADESPVTIADREVETAMRAILKEVVPHHGIQGEEHGKDNPDAEWVWVLDPIDGTKSFITGHPCFATLIALTHRGVPVLGIVDQAITDERWLGAVGYPTTLNGNPVRSRACPDLAHAYVYSTGPEYFCPRTQPKWERITQQVKSVRYGCDCYAYALLATGCVDLVVESGLKPHDFCALVPVVEQSGGIISDWQGKALTVHSDGCLCAAGDKRVHQDALAVLSA